MKFQIKDGNYGEVTAEVIVDGEIIREEVLPFGEDGEIFEGTLEQVEQKVYDDRVLSGWQEQACALVSKDYTTYCESGLSYTKSSTEYTITNNEKTRDEASKKLLDCTLGVQNDFDWTMDSPRVKIDFLTDELLCVFLKDLKELIANNETRLRDTKTLIENMDLQTVQAFITTPNYPTYERTV